MKWKFLVFISLLMGFLLKAQQVIMGVVESENQYRLAHTQILNLRTNKVFTTDENGVFLLSVKNGDKLRFIRKKYERFTYSVNASSFKHAVKIELKRLPKEIEEVRIKYKFSGNLTKDLSYLNEKKKYQNLRRELNDYIAHSSAPEKDPRAFNPHPLPRYQSGAVGVDVVQAIGGIVYLLSKKKKHRLNYATKKVFLRQLRSKINIEYYHALGMDDYDIDRFLAFAEQRFGLEKNFGQKMDMESIQPFLDEALLYFNFNIKSPP
ncbi:MAG: hypothetical protein CSA38_02515 [Flavobacteriales bacterium]|nr:MAG: hypothetical protein CSA38_02515 [Flavobacteriales bacterium]